MLFPAFWRDDRDNRWFVVGANYPSIANSGRLGYSLGPNEIMEWNDNLVTTETLDTLRADFRRMKNFGVDVVRMWAFKNGQGLLWSGDPYHGVIRRPGLNEDFRRNVAAITALAAEEQIKIYWTLFDGADFIIVPNDTGNRLRMKSCFRHLLTDRTGHYIIPFLNYALRNFIDTVNAHSDGVFAIDLINEPDLFWRVSLLGNLENIYSLPLPWPIRRRVENHILNDPRYRNSNPSVENFINFLCSSAAFIRDRRERNILVSTGFAHFFSIQNFHSRFDQYFDFYDFHHYNWLNVFSTAFLPVPQWDSLNIDKPCIISEFGLGGQFQKDVGHISLSQAYRLGRFSNLFRDVPLQELFLIQAECTNNIMNVARRQGYAGCLVWEYGKQYTNRANYYSPYNQRNLNDRAVWEDRYFLVWKPNAASGSLPLGSSIPLNPPDPDGLVGRSVVQVIDVFSRTLDSDGRRPPR